MKGILLSFAILLSAMLDSWAQVRVRGYTRKDGTYVAPHYRSSPNSTKLDNWSTKGNMNPYTGQPGTRNAYSVRPMSPSPMGRSGIPLAPSLSPIQRNAVPASSKVSSGTRAKSQAGSKENASEQKALPISKASGPLFDDRKAVLEYQQQSAAKGNAQAQYSMGLRHLYGIDVPQNSAKAIEFLNAARKGGEIRARNKILELEREKRKAELEALNARELANVE